MRKGPGHTYVQHTHFFKQPVSPLRHRELLQHLAQRTPRSLSAITLRTIFTERPS